LSIEAREPGTGIAIFGSGTMVQQLAEDGLTDESITVPTPIVLRSGKALFSHVRRIGRLELRAANPLSSGEVVLHDRIA